MEPRKKEPSGPSFTAIEISCPVTVFRWFPWKCSQPWTVGLPCLRSEPLQFDPAGTAKSPHSGPSPMSSPHGIAAKQVWTPRPGKIHKPENHCFVEEASLRFRSMPSPVQCGSRHPVISPTVPLSARPRSHHIHSLVMEHGTKHHPFGTPRISHSF